ncbi:MAG: gliding motility-associated C-terminal domain-containing protein, partial [Bacteroidota bacterium]
DPCTINDEQTILDCDGSICIPCQGTPIDCSNGPTSIVGCDDGDPNTVNDEQTILDCDGSICIPCQGIPCAVVANIQNLSTPLTCLSLQDGIGLDASMSTTGADINYEWTYGNDVVGSGINIEVFNEGTYMLLVTDLSTGCNSTAQIEVSIPVVELIPDITLVHESCPGELDGRITVESVTGGQEPYLFSVNGGAFGTASAFTDLVPGPYSVVIQDFDGCTFEADFTIEVASLGFLDLGPDQTVQLGEPFQIKPLTDVEIQSMIWQYEGSISCTDCLEPVVTPLNESTYRLSLIDENGCEITDELTIFVLKALNVYTPNVFSPNNDGINDVFMIYTGPSVRVIRNFQIFDRWGSQLYTAQDAQPNDPQYAWDGRSRGQEMKNGVYIFFAEIEHLDGRLEVLSGEITLLR